MNRLHRWYCRSEAWKKALREKTPWVLGDIDLGPEALEIGPGPGLTTEFVRPYCQRLTAMEIDAELAGALERRMLGSKVTVVCGDATRMPFANRSFSGVVSFTMLHHVPSPDLQDRVLAEAYRVLLPGGVFVGSDSVSSALLKLFHIGDTLTPVDPGTFPSRLRAAGFTNVAMALGRNAFRFSAQHP